MSIASLCVKKCPAVFIACTLSLIGSVSFSQPSQPQSSQSSQSQQRLQSEAQLSSTDSVIASPMHTGTATDPTPLVVAQAAQPSNSAGTSTNSAADTALPSANTDRSSAGKTPIRTIVDDSILTTKIKAAMLANPGVKATEVSVETNSGEVTLSGAVSNQPEIEQAQQIANNVVGVKTVVNKLTLKK